MKSLKYLDTIGTSIDFIPENAFEFYEKSVDFLHLGLKDNKYLNSSGFSERSLTKFRRRTTIDFESNDTHISYLDEKIFNPFLRSYFEGSTPVNSIFVNEKTLDCGDCRNLWLKKSFKQLRNGLRQPKCSNGKSFFDHDSFSKCQVSLYSSIGQKYFFLKNQYKRVK